MFVHAHFGFLRQALHRKPSFVNHQGATETQPEHGRGAGGDGQHCRDFKEEFLTVITGDGSPNGNQRGRGKKSQTGIKATQGF